MVHFCFFVYLQILYSLNQERKEAISSSKLSVELDNKPSAFEQILGISTARPAVSKSCHNVVMVIIIMTK